MNNPVASGWVSNLCLTKKWSQHLTLILLFTLLAACAEDKPILSPLSYDDTVLAFGDSLTYGKGASENQAYPPRLAELIDLKVVNAGVSGETSEQGLQRLSGVLDKTEPNLLILCHGGNDLLRKLPKERTVRHLREMVEMARQREIEVLLVAVPRPGIFLKTDPLYSTLAAESGIPLEDHIMTQVLKEDALKSDAIHPNARGYQLIAEAIAERLGEAGAVQ